MKNLFGTVVLSAFILDFPSSTAAPAAEFPALKSPRARKSVSCRPGAVFESLPIEIDPGPGEKARQNIISVGLGGVIDARITDAFAEIPSIEGEFDFVFIDAWKPDYVRFLNLLRDRVATGGAIVGHNVTNYPRDIRDYLVAIQNDPRLETTFAELSAKGMSVSIVRGQK